MLRTLTILISLFFITASLSAQFFQWQGGNGDWDDPSHWTNNTIPTSSTGVTIDCNCTVRIPTGVDADAGSVLVADNSLLDIRPGGELVINQLFTRGIWVYGQLSNRGVIRVQSQDFGNNYGIIVASDEGLFNNYGSIFIDDVLSGILVNGWFRNWGDVTIFGNATNMVHQYGITLHAGGLFTSYSSAEIEIDHTTISGVEVREGCTFRQYGDLSIESNCTDVGIRNHGSYRNYSTATTTIRGGTTQGFLNNGRLDNWGELLFIGATSGDALVAQEDDLINNYNGAFIQVYGFYYDSAIQLDEEDCLFRNWGEIDVFTIQNGTNCVNVDFDSEMINYASGSVSLRTTADNCLRVNGGTFRNRGGYVYLNSLANQRYSLANQQEGLVINSECGTMVFMDNLTTNMDATFNNAAWLEMQGSGNSFISLGATVNNSGVIHDVNGATTGLGIDNDHGVIVKPLTEIIYPDEPYYDPLEVGNNTNVSIANIIWGKYPDNYMGDYYQNENLMVMHPNYFGYYDEYFAELTLPGGCGSRKYSMRRDSPEPLTGDDPTKLINGSHEVTNVEEMSVYPNPAGGHINIQLPATLDGDVYLQLRNISGRQLFAATYQAGAGELRMNRPANLPAGMYLLTINSENGDFLETRRVTFGAGN